MSEYDDMLPVSLWRNHETLEYVMLDKHNDVIAIFERSRDDHECQRIVDAINASQAGAP